MADLLNKVFMILVRPYYTDAGGNKVFFKGSVMAVIGGDNVALTSTNTTAPANSPVKLNKNGAFKNDPWFLFGTYTSYAKYQEDLKEVMATYGTSNIKTAVYVPMDYQVLPNQ